MKIRPFEICRAKACPFEVRPTEICPVKICLFEVRPAKVYPLKVRPFKVRALAGFRIGQPYGMFGQYGLQLFRRHSVIASI